MGKDINTIEEFQKKYLPSTVGRICPHCGGDISKVRRTIDIIINPNTFEDVD